MAVKKKREYLNSTNAVSVSNRDRLAAYSQSHGQPYKDENGKWQEGDMAGTSARGKMSASTSSNRAGGKTWTFTPKNNDGSPVLKKDGTARQSGRSQIASRSQRAYDVKVGLNNVVGEKAREMLGIGNGASGLGLSIG